MRLLHHRRLTSLLALAMIALAVVGCSSPDGPTPAPTSTSSTSASPGPTLRVDWSAPEKAQLPDGWSLADCPGAAPLICVARGGKTIGQLEMLSYDIATLPEFLAVQNTQGEAAALEDHARRFVAGFTEDRAQGCGTQYTVTSEPLGRLSTADGSAVRYGFTGTLANGSPSEKVLHYTGVRSGRLVLLAATASDPGGCLDDTEGTFFTSSQLQAFQPVLDQLVTAGGLPRPRG